MHIVRIDKLEKTFQGFLMKNDSLADWKKEITEYRNILEKYKKISN